MAKRILKSDSVEWLRGVAELKEVNAIDAACFRDIANEIEGLRTEREQDEDTVLLMDTIMLRDRHERATDSLQRGCELATMISDWAKEIRQTRAAAEAAERKGE